MQLKKLDLELNFLKSIPTSLLSRSREGTLNLITDPFDEPKPKPTRKRAQKKSSKPTRTTRSTSTATKRKRSTKKVKDSPPPKRQKK
jgi:hypothetical protein